MSDHYTEATVNPFIPLKYVYSLEMFLLRKMGYSFEESEPGLAYFYADEYCTDTVYLEDIWVDETDAEEVLMLERLIEQEQSFFEDVPIFQTILKRWQAAEPETASKTISVEAAYYATKLRPGSAGGYATVITANASYVCSTSQFIIQTEDKVKKGELL